MSNTVRIDAGNGRTIELDCDDPATVESAAAEIARLEGDEIANGPRADGRDIDDDPIQYWFVMTLAREGEYRFALPAGAFPALEEPLDDSEED